MPCRTEKKQSFTCSVCERKVTRKAPSRLSAIRRHYKAKHPRKFKEIVKKAAKSRKKKLSKIHVNI